MYSKRLYNLIRGLYRTILNYSNKKIFGISLHSKRVSKGDLFVCLPGYKKPGGECRSDSHLFIDEAISNGAVAIVSERLINIPDNVTLVVIRDTWKRISIISGRFYNFPNKNLNIIGITGTNGKTSTSYMIESVIGTEYKTAVIGTVNNRLGNQIFSTENTTPEAPFIYEFMHRAVSVGIDTMIMEVTSHALALERTNGIKYGIGVFTNFTQDHLDFHGTMENYFQAKLKLFKSVVKEGCAIINKDDYFYSRVKDGCNCHTISYGIKDTEVNFNARNIEFTNNGSTFDLYYNRFFSTKIEIPLIGYHFVSNSLASIAVGFCKKIPLEIIRRNLKKIFVPGRFEMINCGQKFHIIVDFAHTPDAMENTLSQIKLIEAKKIISVFGCGGDRDRTKRPKMGEISEKYCDYTIITSDNPRTEDPKKIIFEIESGMKNNNHETIVDRRDAIKKAIEIAEEGDLVVILGRGHEEYQIKGNEKIRFKDTDFVKNLFKNLYVTGIS